MAIQNRRGAYADYDKTKMVSGEFAVVQGGDPNTESGKAVYISFEPGSAERLLTEEDQEGMGYVFTDPNRDGHIVIRKA